MIVNSSSKRSKIRQHFIMSFWLWSTCKLVNQGATKMRYSSILKFRGEEKRKWHRRTKVLQVKLSRINCVIERDREICLYCHCQIKCKKTWTRSQLRAILMVVYVLTLKAFFCNNVNFPFGHNNVFLNIKYLLIIEAEICT